MEREKLQELSDIGILTEEQLEKMRTPVTILFSDIKGSTTYFETHGDAAGMAMVQRHNDILFPVIQKHDGRIVKTAGDSIMASFRKPVSAIQAAVEMQRALEVDRTRREEEEYIYIRIGIHTGFGLIKDNDIFGDVVNAASRIQQQAEPSQILISEYLLDAAKAASIQCANFGKADLRGKSEAIDIYAVAWSDAATDQLIGEIQARFEAKLRESKKQYDELEEMLESSRDQWRAERRKFIAEIDQLEETIENTRNLMRAELSEGLHSEIRFRLEEAVRARDDVQQQLDAGHAKWETERNVFKAQIAGLQGSVIEAMERANNPTRMAVAVREQVDRRLAEAKQEWQFQWEAERRRLSAEIDRLRKTGSSVDDRKEAQKRAILEKLGKIPAGLSQGKTADQWKSELEDAKVRWDTERDKLNFQVGRLERDLQRVSETTRSEIVHELRGQYEPQLAEANEERKRLAQDLQSITAQIEEERRRLNARIETLERSLPEAQTAARLQVEAELQAQFDAKLEEVQRQRSRSERRLQDLTEELESERRRSKRQVALLEEQLNASKEAVFKAQRQSRV